MDRIPLKKRALPNYTRGEEIINMTTHIFGTIFGIVVLIIGVIISKNTWDIAGSIIYGLSMISLFTVSSVYHGLRPSTGKKVMRIIDHCTIYILIAGTYTPILFSAIRPMDPVLAWTIFSIEWGLTALAITLTAIDMKKYAKFSMFCYLAMGWFIVVAFQPAVEAVGWQGMLWLIYGGVAYTIGAILYGLGKKIKYFHSVFHVFVNLGCVFQAICILQYVL